MFPLASRTRRRRAALGAAALAATTTLLVPPGPARATPFGQPHCHHMSALHIPGAEHQQTACLDELTTAGTVASGHTDPADWAGLTPEALPTPSGVPGIQVDGYFPDSSRTKTNHAWNHDSQFVLRLPDRWNGGLVVTGTPGNREQYANDRAIADWVLSRGYAFASTDKGNTGAAFHRDGRRPGDAVAEWNTRVTQLARAARKVVAQRYGRPADRTLATGMSNGGYLVRWQLENHPELYDGGVDWEGTLWREQGPNLFTFLPTALRHYPAVAAGGPDADRARAALHAAGFPAGSEFLWPYHHRVYWDLTQRVYREEFDPDFDGATEAGTPYCTPSTPGTPSTPSTPNAPGSGCDADYVYAERPDEVRRAVRQVALTGRIGKPLLTVHGTLDVLLPIGQSADAYARLVRSAGRGELHRTYRIEDGTHTDSLVDAFPDRLRPLVPCHRTAFLALERQLDHGVRPPASGTVHRPAGQDSAELLRECTLDTSE